ncbi:hypothetical protein ACJJTC_013280 [Scirpophaga incertulas]
MLSVSPPEFVDREFTKPLLCGPGPADLWPSVIEAMSKPSVTTMCEEFYHVLDDIRLGIQYLFQTRSKLVLAMSGSGHAGMEAIISNLLGPDDTLLIAARGIWDERALGVAKRYGNFTIVTEVPISNTFDFEHLESMLKKVKPTALFITHGDSSTGSVQNLEGLGKICHKHRALLLVDTVVSIAAVPFLMDEWEVDAVYTSTQKALSGPPGISPVAFSARAEHKIKNRKHEPPFYFDIPLLALQWNCYGNSRKYHHTISSPMIWALRACLQELAKETLQKSWERHTRVANHFHKRIQELPVKFLITKPEDRLSTVTTVVLPPGYDYLQFVKYMREKHNILIFAGLGPTVGKALRIGIMGVNSTIEVADALIEGMTSTLKGLKKSSL